MLKPARGIGAALVAAAALSLAGCQWEWGHADSEAETVAFDDAHAETGAELIEASGCGACHVIPGIAAARGHVGPPLNRIGRRVYIAGLLPNTPDNMVRWLRDPQAIVPGNAMPNLGLTEEQARDITEYLFTLD